VVIVLFLSDAAAANEMRVEPRTLRAGQMTTITITLEGDFAAADRVNVPLINLTIAGEPWVATEFAWINGRTTRRKVFRYRARANGPGQARVGPVILTAADGQSDTLPAVVLQVEADRVASSNDAERVLADLLAAGREPLFVIARADRTRVFAGEPVIVTWTLYNASTIQQWNVARIPKLTDFWTEELERDHASERVYVGNQLLQSMTVRRVALFPLRSGRITIEGLTVEAAVLERVRRGPFSMFEGNVVETAYTSAPLVLDVDPVPPGPKVDAVGTYTLTCSAPSQPAGGPVSMLVTLAGTGNVRAAAAPHFDGPVAGRVQVEGGLVNVDASGPALTMTRQWQYLIFPSETGRLPIPAVAMTIFDPAARHRRELRCAASALDVTAAAAASTGAGTEPAAAQSPSWRWLAVAAASLLVTALTARSAIRRIRMTRRVKRITHSATPAEIRARLEQEVDATRLPHDPGPAGDAWRSLMSLLDAAERGRAMGEDADREIRARVRDLLAALR
jgi:hypothetical protein